VYWRPLSGALLITRGLVLAITSCRDGSWILVVSVYHGGLGLCWLPTKNRAATLCASQITLWSSLLIHFSYPLAILSSNPTHMRTYHSSQLSIISVGRTITSSTCKYHTAQDPSLLLFIDTRNLFLLTAIIPPLHPRSVGSVGGRAYCRQTN